MPERLKTVVFCVTVEQARKTACILRDVHGVNAEWVCGDASLCPKAERRRILKQFAGGDIECVCNVGVLTTGWDYPGLEHIVLARPTKSLPLFTQIFGRGTRPLPGVVDFEDSSPGSRKAAIAQSAKPHFKFTDLRDNAMRHKLVTPVDVLGGEMGLDVDTLALAKEELDKAESSRPLNEVIEEAIQRKKAQEEADRKRLAQFKADAKYQSQRVDVFGGGSVDTPKKKRGARFMYGKFKGQLVEDAPTWYLRGALEKGFIKAKWLLGAIKKELRAREQPVESAAEFTSNSGISADDVNRMLWDS